MWGRELWSNGYGCSKGCGLEYWCPILGGHFFTLICCRNCIVCLKRPKINEKEARVGPFKNIFMCLLFWQPDFLRKLLTSKSFSWFIVRKDENKIKWAPELAHLWKIEQQKAKSVARKEQDKDGKVMKCEGSSMTRFGVFWTLDNFLKPLATVNCPNLLHS